MQLKRFKIFTSREKTVLKKYPDSSSIISATIESLLENPMQGNPYPGFGDINVRKTRIALSEYKLGTSKGLRLVFLYIQEKSVIVPLHIYKKGTLKEQQVKEEIKTALREVIKEIEEQA